MAQLYIPVLVWMMGFGTESTTTIPCCEKKRVGGVSYTFVEERDTTIFNCLSNCVYQKDGESEGQLFCFAAGELEATCEVQEGCKCGVKKTSRIVGGSETEINEYPWMAKFGSFFCGGTLIASQWILTAAHCITGLAAGDITMVLGEHDLLSQSESLIPRKEVSVTTVIGHPDYKWNSSGYFNDIALLKLSEEVDLNVYIPACLPSTSDNFEGKKAWVYGWGATSEGGSTSPKLLEVEVTVVSNSVCKTAMSQYGYLIDNSMVCAGGEAGKDSCQGDSGGPLTVDVSGQHYLIGDTSFGYGCGREGTYGVYGDVAFFRSWIDTTIRNNGGAKYCPAA